MIDSSAIAWADRSDRDRLVLSGPDRVKFLNNLCTNDVKRLKPGDGCEAFVTSPQGKLLAWISIHDCGDHLLLRADPEGLSLASPHFAKYGVFDNVEFDNVRDETFEIHFTGIGTDAVLEHSLRHEITPDSRDLATAAHNGPLRDIILIRESPLGLTGMTVIGPAARREEFLTGVIAHMPVGSRPLSLDEVEGLRIEAGTPRFGADATTDHLPQEIARDTKAISFVKGCYLGQETVARLDALGHVNKILRRVVVSEGPPPAIGTTLRVGDLPVGTITSSGRSPINDRVCALAVIKVKPAPPGTHLTWDGGQGSVALL